MADNDSVGKISLDLETNTKGLITTISKVGEKIKQDFSKSVSRNLLSSAANIKAAFDMATGSVRMLTSSFKGCMSAYQTQIESEARLGATMRNTTGATKEQIQSVKDLAGEIQGLGVVGDEVSLAGMQELATYVENADSLKTMMPVLDDMIAQQYGFSASTDSAVTISTMLGKVLQGQTSALSRYGYSFTEAQEQLLKYGTEEQRVATLAAVVSESVGGVNKALADTPTGKMKQLSNDFGDLKETLGGLVTNVLYPIVRYLDVIVLKLNNVFSVLNENIKNMFGITDDVSSGSGIISLSDSADDASDAVDGTTDSIKALKKAAAGFDQLNILSESSDTSTDTSGVTASVTPALDISKTDSAVNSFVDKMSSRLMKIFEPIKKSWDKYGTSVINAWIRAFNNIKNLVVDIGKSFSNVWQSKSAQSFLESQLMILSTIGNMVADITAAWDNGWNGNDRGIKLIQSYIDKFTAIINLLNTIGENFRDAWSSGDGEKIISNILDTMTNTNNIVKSITKNFNEAFKSKEGKRITQTILDIVTDISGFTKDISKEWEKWAEKLNFQPLINNFNSLLTPIKDIVDNCLDGMRDFNKSVIIPTSKWVIEEAVPAVFNAIANALKLINEFGKTAGNTLKSIWDNFLKHVVGFVGDTFTMFFSGVADVLEKISNSSAAVATLESLVLIISSLVAGIAAYNAVMTIVNAVQTAAAVSGGILNAIWLANPVGVVVAGVVALIAVIITVIAYWDDIIAGLEWFGGWIWDDVLEPVVHFFENAWKEISEVFAGIGIWFEDRFHEARNGIEDTWNNVSQFFESVWKNIQSIFSNVNKWFREQFGNAWSNVRNVWNGAGTFFSGVWNGIRTAFGTAREWLVSQFTGAWNTITGLFNRGGQIFIGIRDAIGAVFTNAVNNLIDGINWVIAQPFNGLNSALQGIKDVDILGLKPFDWISTIDVPQIPHLATGGIVKAPTLALVGDNKGADHDPEVVSPLSKLQSMMNSGNPEIISLLLKIIALLENEEGTYQNIIYLDSEVIDRKLVKVRKRKNRRYRGATS
ncbi:MAG: hypothetical protein IJ192_00625 [Clostridia bacterium]|nr:hypothetical protein [Clostridia bacterium]